MTDYSPTHDYRVGGIRYDARVVNAGGAYLLSGRDDWAAFHFGDDELERQAAADKAALGAIFDAREAQIHRPVTWSRLGGRAVCTCGLALTSLGRLVDTNGHRDQRWDHEIRYVAQVDDEPTFVAVCQDCHARDGSTDLDSARRWCTEHSCTPTEPRPATPDAREEPTQPGQAERAVAAGSKIVDEGEVVRWIHEGRTFGWMTEEYERRYALPAAPSMFSNFRRRRGLDRHITRDSALIPWTIKDEHRWAYPLMMLRFEERRRSQLPLDETDERRLESWLGELAELNAVVLYDPDTPDGFYLVPRQAGDDDVIRRPSGPRA